MPLQPKFDHTQSDEIVATFKANGFVIVQGLLCSDSGQLDQLRLAADLVARRTREQEWPYKRTVGKQFPPWNDESPDVWGVQHIMHPDLGQPAFGGLYFSPRMLALVARLGGERGSEHAMAGLLNLLIEPQEHHFALDWHRDSIKASVGEQEERARLRAKAEHGGVQWNLALYEDACLFAVPGSHLRPRTAAERALTTGAAGAEAMPNGVCVGLAAGEAVFYDPQILHRGTYNKHSKRRTLHGAHLDSRAPVQLAAGILQHFEKSGPFYARETFCKNSVPLQHHLVAQQMVDRLIDWTEMAKIGGVEMEFVQDNV